VVRDFEIARFELVVGVPGVNVVGTFAPHEQYAAAVRAQEHHRARFAAYFQQDPGRGRLVYGRCLHVVHVVGREVREVQVVGLFGIPYQQHVEYVTASGTDHSSRKCRLKEPGNRKRGHTHAG